MTPACSIVIPVYDEAETLPVLYERLTAVLTRLGLAYEIVFVNDGSRDRSAAILRDLHAKDARVRYLAFSRNFGHQVAISAGLDFASGDAVVVMDADLQDPPEVVGDLVARWHEGYDVVFAVRSRRSGEGVFKRATAALFYRIFHRVTSVAAPLDAGDFRLMSRRAVEALRSCRERNRFMRGLAGWVGFRQARVEYERDPRYAGESKYSLAKMTRFAFNGIAAFSLMPMRLATYAGLALVLAGVTLLLYLAAARTLGRAGLSVAGTLVPVVLLVGGLQLLALGIIGEYLGRVYEEVLARPLYIVAEAVGFDRSSPS
jgi:polyisoprenyl-phosphate glycosyltransferase